MMSRKKTTIINNNLFISNINMIVNENGGKYAFAETIGVSYDAVRQWCLGENFPDGRRLLSIHDKFAVSIDWLLTGTGEKQLIQGVAEAKDAYNGNNDFMSGWPEDHRNDCLMLKEILDSGDKVAIAAIKSNLVAFHESIRKNSRIDKLEKDVQELKKAQASNPGTPDADAAAITKRKAI